MQEIVVIEQDPRLFLEPSGLWFQQMLHCKKAA
jgi:hypothetical protein